VGVGPRRVSYANVAATLALFFALGGTAIAAHHYLLSSTKQIRPSVLRRLRGASGRAGPTGAAGSTGSTGATGATGADLTTQTTLPSGESESGVYAGDSGDMSGRDFIAIDIDFTQPLAAPLETSKIIATASAGNGSTCTGPGHAAAGYLCLYSLVASDATPYAAAGADLDMPSPDPGEIYFFEVTGAGNYVEGTWTVTAP
jgi:hypothetical protein